MPLSKYFPSTVAGFRIGRPATVVCLAIVLGLGGCASPDTYADRERALSSQAPRQNNGDTSDQSATPSGAPRTDADFADAPIHYAILTQNCFSPGTITGDRESISVRNPGSVAADVYLARSSENSSDTPEVYAELRHLGPSSSRIMRTQLPNGTYHMICAIEDEEVERGADFTVTGSSVAESAHVAAVGYNQMAGPTDAYNAWVDTQWDPIMSAVDAVQSDISQGDFDAARRDYLKAHHAWRLLGGLRADMDEADSEIDGIEDGIGTEASGNGQAAAGDQGSGDSSSSNGQTAAGDQGSGDSSGDSAGLFEQLKYQLFASGTSGHSSPTGSGNGASGSTASGTPNSSTRSPQEIVTDLQKAIAKARKDFPSHHMRALNMNLRVHEILEETQRFVLTGRSDFGAHADAETILADIEATQRLVAVLSPLLEPRLKSLAKQSAVPGAAGFARPILTLAELNEELRTAHATVQSLASTYGPTTDAQGKTSSGTPLSHWASTDREKLNATISSCVEDLAPMAAFLALRRTQ